MLTMFHQPQNRRARSAVYTPDGFSCNSEQNRLYVASIDSAERRVAGAQSMLATREIASGEKSKSEALGVGEEEFAPWPIGVTG